LPVSLLVTNYPAVNQHGNTLASIRWQEILQEPLPEGAVLLSNDRNEMMPMWYYQFVEQQRPDLIGLFPLIVSDPAYADVGRLLDQALISQRSVFLVKPMDGLNLKADIIPVGSVYEARPVSMNPTHKLAVELAGAGDQTVRLIGYDLNSNPVTPGATLDVTLYWEVAQDLIADFTSYIHVVGPAGERLTQSDHLPGGVYYPSSLWQPGEILRDRHTLTIPESAQEGTYRLVAGMYHQPQPGIIEPLGNGVEIGIIHLD
jgi:hypothetical protein